MILSDVRIKELLSSDELSIKPLSDYSIQASSVDLRLGNNFAEIADSELLTLNEEIEYNHIQSPDIVIAPLSFVLATTMEYLKLPNYLTAFVEGRSSIGRMGLFVQNAGWVDAGFEGEITLELFNASKFPIKLESGRRVCQLVFAEMNECASLPYRGKYFGQKNAVGSKVYLDGER